MPRIGDTVYYEREDEEHSGIDRPTIAVDGNFRFVHKGLLWRISAFVFYRCIMWPFAWAWCKIRFRHKIENRRVLRGYRRRGLFAYGNHTLMLGDAFIPNLIFGRKYTYVVVGPQNLSARGTCHLWQMCGAIPTPTSIRGYRGFLEALEKRTLEHGAVVVYPEAHIWPYYTGIRSFPDTSFSYPARLGEPVFCFTNTFHRRPLCKTPKVVTYVDGPFYPDESLSLSEQAQELRDRVYATMCERAALSTYTPIRYLKKETDESEAPQ